MSILTFAKYAGIVVLALGIVWKIQDWGYDRAWEKHENIMAQLKAQYEEEVSRLSEINREVEVRYVDRVRTVEVKGETIVREVPRYITVEDNARCDISPSFVELHDAASQNRLPEAVSATEFAEGTSQPQLSDVGRTVVENYNTYYQLREQLLALQEWAKNVSAQSKNP